MAYRRGSTSRKHLLAKIAEKSVPCAFCRLEVDDEAMYGKLYSIGDIHCHYFCVLLSCCLIQKGKDSEGLFGFLYQDILAEIERSKKHKCSYCYKEGATLGCSVSQCRKQFHLPCGRERNVVSLYYGNFKSFCEKHAPKQNIPSFIMDKAKIRKSMMRKIENGESIDTDSIPETICVICYEPVNGFPSPSTFWPPCCAVDAWFHRDCIQRMSLSAGIHYLKCPLCNDKENFYEAVLNQGYYVPDRDAAWELEQNAFSEIYERQMTCSAETCYCEQGRGHDEESGPWDIKMCLLCGWSGVHTFCGGKLWLCTVCEPSAPDADVLQGIEKPIENIRHELNLKTPRKRKLIEPEMLRNIENTLLSPIKLMEKVLYEKKPDAEITLDGNILKEMRDRFNKPKPLMAKKRIVDDILERLLKDIEVNKEHKKKTPIKESHSPEKNMVPENVLIDNIYVKTEHPELSESTTKGCDEKILDNKKLKTVNIVNDSMEISENNQIINIDLVKIEPDITPIKEKCSLKFSSKDKEILEDKEINIDIESFKSQYLTEVGQNIEKQVQETKKEVLKEELSAKKSKKRTKNKTHLSIRNKNINFKIKFKDEDFKVQIKKKKKEKKSICLEYLIKIDENPKILKQYVINKSTKIERPSENVSPIKMKRIKLEKSPDNLKQTSISSFFSAKTSK
ncbi:unnamed protein product [Danaus chrysippus]|uniref:(African queen) hypothetical protein n=1 Tax=Danaus chrysippus TaxID=151541 RepID=A0A8J2W3B6_9NEOP|nr:unnamed protein product [Danaus chrysippus]